jgi:hypothetical protein
MSHEHGSILSPKSKKLIFTPTEHVYIHELERITTYVRMGKEKKTWVSKVGLVGLFEIEWKIPCHFIY